MIDLHVLTKDEQIRDVLTAELGGKINFRWNSGIIPDDGNWGIVDTRAISEESWASVPRSCKKRTILISDRSDEYNVLQFLDESGINNLIGLNSGDLASELTATVENILLGGRTPTLDKFPTFANATIVDSSQVTGLVDHLLQKFDLSSFFDSPQEYLRVIGNELLTNAIYNGAVSENQSRIEKVRLENGQEIVCTMGMDDSFIGITVTDMFGGLTRDKIVNSLVRSFKTKEFQNKQGGAGLGFYLAFSHSNSMIVRSSKGKRTEITCLIDKNKRYKNYKTRITSFHFYEEV